MLPGMPQGIAGSGLPYLFQMDKGNEKWVTRQKNFL